MSSQKESTQALKICAPCGHNPVKSSRKNIKFLSITTAVITTAVIAIAAVQVAYGCSDIAAITRMQEACVSAGDEQSLAILCDIKSELIGL